MLVYCLVNMVIIIGDILDCFTDCDDTIRSRAVFYGVSLAIGVSLGSVIALAVLFHYSTKVFPQVLQIILKLFQLLFYHL